MLGWIWSWLPDTNVNAQETSSAQIAKTDNNLSSLLCPKPAFVISSEELNLRRQNLRKISSGPVKLSFREQLIAQRAQLQVVSLGTHKTCSPLLDEILKQRAMLRHVM